MSLENATALKIKLILQEQTKNGTMIKEEVVNDKYSCTIDIFPLLKALVFEIKMQQLL